MYIKLKHVDTLGFTGCDIWSSQFHWLYKKEYPDKKTFVVINNHCPQQIERFQLDARQYKKYKANKLSLVPAGHCGGLGGNEYVTGNVIWTGEFKSQKQLRTLLEAAETLINTD